MKKQPLFENIMVIIRIIVIAITLLFSLFFTFIKAIFSKDKEYVFQGYLRRWCLKGLHLAGAKIELVGAENIPDEGPCLIVSNYQNPIDLAIIISQLKRKLYVTAGPAFFLFPMSLITKSCGYLSLDYKKPVISGTEMEKIEEKLKDGKAVFMFMSKHSNLKRTIDDPVNGPAYVSLLTKTPITPIAINASSPIPPIPSVFGTSRVIPVKVVIGKPIDINGETNDKAGRVIYTGKIVQNIQSLIR